MMPVVPSEFFGTPSIVSASAAIEFDSARCDWLSQSMPHQCTPGVLFQRAPRQSVAFFDARLACPKTTRRFVPGGLTGYAFDRGAHFAASYLDNRATATRPTRSHSPDLEQQ